MSAGGGPLVSVVIPTRDRRDLLARTLRTVLWQSHRDLEVIVVDEASTDGTADAVAAEPDPRVRLLRHEEPKGVAAARNTGIEHARGELVAFVDDDDLWAPEKLAQQVAALRGRPEATWSCTAAVRLLPSLRQSGPERLARPDRVLRDLLTANVVPGGGSSVVARTDVVRRLGGFDTALSNAADWDMWIRLATTGPVASVDRPLVGYLVSAGGMAHDSRRARESLAQVAGKHAGLAREHGSGVDRVAFDHYQASNLLRARRRSEAFSIYRRLLRRRALQPVAGAVAAASVVSPRARDAADAVGRLRLPRGWSREVETWLAPLR
jgi:glycosyltransferase involved in cell wall biosynthesis